MGRSQSWITTDRLCGVAICSLSTASWAVAAGVWVAMSPIQHSVADNWNPAWLWSVVRLGIPAVLILTAGATSLGNRRFLRAVGAIVALHILVGLWAITAVGISASTGFQSLALATALLALIVAIDRPRTSRARPRPNVALALILGALMLTTLAPAVAESTDSLGRVVLSTVIATARTLAACVAAWLIGRHTRPTTLVASFILVGLTVASAVDVSSVRGADLTVALARTVLHLVSAGIGIRVVVSFRNEAA